MTEKEKKLIEKCELSLKIIKDSKIKSRVFYDVADLEALLNLIQKQDTEINKLNKRISDLEFALIDMVYQFADESKNQLNTMGLSALETAFCELDFDNPIDKDIVIKKFAELQKKYYE